MAKAFLMPEIVSRSRFQYDSLNTWNKLLSLDTTASAPSVHSPIRHLHVTVSLEVISNIKISSPVVRVNKAWPNNMSLGSCIQLISDKRSVETLIPGNSSWSLQGILWTFCTKDNKCCSTSGPYLSLLDKLLYLTELPHQNFFPLHCPRQHRLTASQTVIGVSPIT